MTNWPSSAVRVVAVVVTYEPDAQRLAQQRQLLQPQVDAIVVVDNGSRVPPASADLRLPRNLGLAAAQNLGIAQARQQQATHVLLLDQDSVPDEHMVPALLRAARQAAGQGLSLAAVGPLPVDATGRYEGFVQHRSGRYCALCEPDAPWIECDFLIASGSLIPMAVLDAVGTMDESLFIDKIDTEWALRAQAAGLKLIGAPAARLYHRLGERSVRLWLGQWRELQLHKPARYYYMVRNSLLLRRLPHASATWRSADARQLRSILIYFGLLAPGRLRALSMMLRGLLDGLRGASGPLR